MPHPLVIVSNEKVHQADGQLYCRNHALKVLTEGLSEHYDLSYIARQSKRKGRHQFLLKNTWVASNIWRFLFGIFRTYRKKRANYLLVSITPYTFLSFLMLFVARKKTFVYLMSDGHDEWKHLLGGWSVWIYHLMYKAVTAYAEVMVCHERLHTKCQSKLITASRLEEDWFQDRQLARLDKPRLLYVGRLSAEKGVLDFINMFEGLDLDADLSVVGDGKDLQAMSSISSERVHFMGYVSGNQALIDIYDQHNIMVLPSYTEAHPHVLDEALARHRPVIVFEDIAYVVQGKKGVFVAKRNPQSLLQTIHAIIQNYVNISVAMSQNALPTRQSMIKQIASVID